MGFEFIQRHTLVGIKHKKLGDEVSWSLRDELWELVVDLHDLSVRYVVVTVVERSVSGEH